MRPSTATFTFNRKYEGEHYQFLVVWLPSFVRVTRYRVTGEWNYVDRASHDFENPREGKGRVPSIKAQQGHLWHLCELLNEKHPIPTKPKLAKGT